MHKNLEIIKNNFKGEKMNIIKKYYKHILIGISSGILNGLFGAGGGCIVVPAMEFFLKTEEKKSHATAVAVILLTSAVSSFFYLRGGHFDLKLWALVSAGGTFGGMVGAKLLPKISVKWLKIIFGSVILITSFKMIF